MKKVAKVEVEREELVDMIENRVRKTLKRSHIETPTRSELGFYIKLICKDSGLPSEVIEDIIRELECRIVQQLEVGV